jgi:hypothetical protein
VQVITIWQTRIKRGAFWVTWICVIRQRKKPMMITGDNIHDLALLLDYHASEFD